MFRRVMWAMFALAAAGAATYALSESEATREWAGGAFGLTLGLGMVAMASAGVEEGSIKGRRRRVDRAEYPTSFWGIVAIYGAVGLVLVGGGLYMLLV